MNDEFLNKAFTQYEQEIIQDMTVEGINQDVKISLIGDDIINPEYGFDPTAQSLISDEDREKEATDYSSILPRSIYHHEKAYFIRDVLSTHGTPYTSITPEGQLFAYYYNEICGIAPVLYIALDSVNIE